MEGAANNDTSKLSSIAGLEEDATRVIDLTDTSHLADVSVQYGLLDPSDEPASRKATGAHSKPD